MGSAHSTGEDDAAAARASHARQLALVHQQHVVALRRQQQAHEDERRQLALGAGCAAALVLAGGFVGWRALLRERGSAATLRSAVAGANTELELVRSRAARDVAAARDFGASALAKSMLETADNLERAVQSAQGAQDAAAGDSSSSSSSGSGSGSGGEERMRAVLQGLELTESQLQRSFGAHGVQRFGAVGDVFDPHLHEAMFEVDVDGAADGDGSDVRSGEVAQLLKSGYTLNGRVIRPAQVATVK